ncbi:MAG: hypothetical protein AAF539_07910, partial [Planctomycetota bacterium]
NAVTNGMTDQSNLVGKNDRGNQTRRDASRNSPVLATNEQNRHDPDGLSGPIGEVISVVIDRTRDMVGP